MASILLGSPDPRGGPGRAWGTEMHSANRTPPLMRIPPPLLFVATFLVGLGLQRLVPLTVHGTQLIRTSRLIGIGLLACAVLIALSCVGLFLTAGTTLIPHGKASRLISAGPYRFTRNPMYLSLTLGYLGAAAVLAQIWPLLLLLLPLAIMNTVVIPFEEARLREGFGVTFGDYCKRVRRWI
jgi:protein-S-isoprenylcysteine O-methyltransferase Ste14